MDETAEDKIQTANGDIDGAVKRRIQIIVISAVSAFIVLFVVMVVQVSVIIGQNNQKRELRISQAALQSALADAEGANGYYSSDKFVKEWFLREFGYATKGSQVFE
jgi:hypothetical protein